MHVAALVAEPLAAEVIGYPVLLELFQARIEGLVIGRKGREAQGEAVSRMGPALELALVTHLLEYAQACIFGTGQVRVGLARQVQTEPLTGQGLPVLEAGIADRANRHAGGTRQATGRFLGVQVTFFDPQPEVLALAREGMSSTSST